MGENFIERLLAFMADAGINDNQMTVAAGLSVGAIGKIKLGKSKGMNSANIEKILHTYPQLSGEWLMTGRGEMYRTEDSNGVEIKGNNELITIIREQAEEIGQLKERIAQLEREKAAGGSSAHDVDSARSAHAG